MIIEELSEANVEEQIENDLLWIHEIIDAPPGFYSIKAKAKAKNLLAYLTENRESIMAFKFYCYMRERCIQEAQRSEPIPQNPSLFD